MTSDRQRDLIERLLSEAEEAVDAGQWDVVARYAQSVLALEPTNSYAIALKAATERMSAAIPTQVPPPQNSCRIGTRLAALLTRAIKRHRPRSAHGNGEGTRSAWQHA